MTTLPGQESPSAKKGDGDITAIRTIQTPLALTTITGSLTEVDRIYRLTHRSLLQNGYSLTHLTKTDTVPLGEPEPVTDEVAALKKTVNTLVDESMDLIRENRTLIASLFAREEEIRQLQRMQTALEDTISRVTS
jgi:hypothetical protein